MFNVSDKLVCVNDALTPKMKAGEWEFPCGFVKIGAIYCVSEMREERFSNGVRLRVHITGVPAIWRGNGYDYGFSPSRFRKLSEVQAENELARTITNFPAHTK